MNLAKLIQNHYVAVRYFHTATVYNTNIGKAMKKVLGNSGKKRRFVDTPPMPTPSSLSKGMYEGRGSGNSRRAAVLNKLFMRYITDLMATGENNSEFLGHGIEINRVRITPDFKILQVYWLSRGNQNDEYVEALLKRNAGYLRNELSGLRVMGSIPKITFMKDQQYSSIVEVDVRLAKADYGEYHEPVELATKLKTEFELYAPLDPSIREKIQTLVVEEESEIEEELLPSMAQNVLGLDHQEILNRVMRVMKKSKASHRQDISCDSDYNPPINENPIGYESARKQREAFREFLEKRELERKKAHKENKNYSPDYEYLKELQSELHEQHYKNLQVYEDFDSDDDDYVEEDDFKK